MRFMRVDEAVELMKLEYADVTGLTLTLEEARELWNLSEELCERAVRLLVTSSFLIEHADGSFARPE
jgi:hypothetical protein